MRFAKELWRFLLRILVQVAFLNTLHLKRLGSRKGLEKARWKLVRGGWVHVHAADPGLHGSLGALRETPFGTHRKGFQILPVQSSTGAEFCHSPHTFLSALRAHMLGPHFQKVSAFETQNGYRSLNSCRDYSSRVLTHGLFSRLWTFLAIDYIHSGA